MARVRHWDQVHSRRAPEEATWWQPRLALSLEWISRVTASRGARIIDVGGGSSTLADHLVDAGRQNLTVVDLSEVALGRVRARLGERGENVEWVVSDVLDLSGIGPFDVWHDRAVFHFFVDEGERVRYREVMTDAVGPGGHAVIATFGPAAPEYCSGLPVHRYSAKELVAFFADRFEPVESRIDAHETPSGATQEFVAVLMHKV